MGGVWGAGLARGGLARALDPLPVVLAGRRCPDFWRSFPWVEADFSQPGQMQRLVQELRPRAILHAAALSRIDLCEQDPALAERLHAGTVAELLASLGELSSESRIPCVICSTDQVFDGRAEGYAEDAPVSPLHEYGRSKARGEQLALQAGAIVLRLPLLLGPSVPGRPEKAGAEAGALLAAREGRPLRLFVDEWRAPADPAQLVAPVARLLREPGHQGVFHLAGADAVSRFELGELACAASGIESPHLPASLADWQGDPRPPRLILRCERARRELGFEAPDLRQSLARLCPRA